ncbi:MAG: ABC transporter ATP-binding protein [Firmicutes bacterium]|nr:ABC transporter ATP-binding protein [Bacillota bacterium]
MALITLRELTKVFNETVVAVDKVTLHVPDNAVICILGPSGCGKTTLMRMIAGLEQPTEGKIFFDDDDVTELPARERNVAMVFQFPAVYPHLTVRANIAFPLIAEGVKKDDAIRRAEEVAESLEISESLDLFPDALDAGAKQKVSIARAIVRKPRVFLFDEPLSNIDPNMRVDMKSLIKKLSRDVGQTFIYVTHDQSEAMTLADYIVVMKDGKVLQYGRPEEIYERPGTDFVGWFLGNPGMNFLQVEARKFENTWCLVSDHISIPFDGLKNLETGKRYKIGIRPEHISLVDDPKEVISGICDMVEPMGGRKIVHLKVGEDRLRVKVDPNRSITPGEKVYFSLPPEHIRIFDIETGRNIPLDAV